MTEPPPTFEFIVTIRPKGQPEDVCTTKVSATDTYDAKKKALQRATAVYEYVEVEHAGFEVLTTDCVTPRWRREIGHAILSEKEIDIDGQKCLEVETEFAVVLVGPQDVYASISKTKREAMYWGVYGGKKHGRLRGHAAQWFMTQQHRFGRKGVVKPDSRTTRKSCGGEIYKHAATGITSQMEGEKRQAEFRAKEDAGRTHLQPRIDAGEFDPKNFDSHREACKAFGRAKQKLGVYNGPFFSALYPRVAA